MESIILRNHDAYREVLQYNPQTGHYEEKSRDQVSLDKLDAKGFYVNTGNSVIGVYASTEGPICFCNDQRFPLANPACRVELNTSIDGNQFILSWNEQIQFSISYRPTPYREYDSWSATDEDVDFFAWIKSNIADPTFYTYYTIG